MAAAKVVPAPKTVRCAIYTRKSTEEGLNQEDDEIEEEEGFDAALVLEQHGGDRVDGLELLVALL